MTRERSMFNTSQYKSGSQWVLLKYLNKNPHTLVISPIYLLSLYMYNINSSCPENNSWVDPNGNINWLALVQLVSWDVSLQQTQHLKSQMSRTVYIRASITVISIIWIFFTVQNYHIFSLGKIKTHRELITSRGGRRRLLKWMCFFC